MGAVILGCKLPFWPKFTPPANILQIVSTVRTVYQWTVSGVTLGGFWDSYQPDDKGTPNPVQNEPTPEFAN